jgi:hypothetical protein
MHLYYLHNILERLKVKEYEKVKWKLFFKNNIFFNLRHRNSIIYNGKRDSIMYVKYKSNNKIFNFKIYIVVEKYMIHYSIYDKDDIDNNSCIIIFYDKKYKYCYIESIINYDECLIGSIYSPKGIILFEFVLKFIKKIIANKYKVKYIKIQDNSKIFCESEQKFIDLSDFFMLIRGNTWYGKYGFVPCNEKKRHIYNQKVVNIIKVKDTMIEHYIKGTIKRLGITCDKLFKKYKNESIMNFIKIFIKKIDKKYYIFCNIYKQILEELCMYKLSGTCYRLKIN